MRVVISAAGLGSRLGFNKPKCLLPIRDGLLIDYLLALLPPEADVRIVVGFREEDVIAHVSRHWPNVSFVRNPSFATTSNSYSVHLASRHLNGPYLSIDGDLLIEKASFLKFLDRCRQAPETVVGVVRKTTQEAIAVRMDQAGFVTEFMRPGAPGYDESEFEWSGVAFFKGVTVQPNERFVFEELARHLPLRGVEIRCWEIDTPTDLERAVQGFSPSPEELPWRRRS